MKKNEKIRKEYEKIPVTTHSAMVQCVRRSPSVYLLRLSGQLHLQCVCSSYSQNVYGQAITLPKLMKCFAITGGLQFRGWNQLKKNRTSIRLKMSTYQ